MALTTVARGRVYDWSHAVGRGAAAGTGFNYPQTMCLGKGGIVYVANRGNENNFGMRVNNVKIGAPGEEELLAEFFHWGEGDGTFHLAVRRRRRRPADSVYVSDEWNNTISVFDSWRQLSPEMGKDRQRRWGTLAPGRSGVREKRQHHRRRQWEQSPASVHPATASSWQMRQGRERRRRVQPALGRHPRSGGQYLRRGLEESPRPETVSPGQVL